MREKQGQNTTGIVGRPKQSKSYRVLRAANTWQEVSVRNNKNSSLPGLGREEQSVARTLVPLNFCRECCCLSLLSCLIQQEEALGAVLSQNGGDSPY